MNSIEEACRAACIGVGIDYKHVPYDGNFHTANLSNDPKGKNDGRIKVFADRQGGIVWNYKTGENQSYFVNRSSHEVVSVADREHIQREQLHREREQQAKYDKAAVKAKLLWDAATPAPANHPYLIRKQIKPHHARVGTWTRSITNDAGQYQKISIDNCLLIPLFNPTGELRSLQSIFPEKHGELDRDKDMLPGGAMAGLFGWLGAKTENILIAEGFATAATLFEATGYRVYIAFTATNLMAVGCIVRDKLPDAKITFCADNDKSTGNPGLTKANDAAAAVDGLVAVPPIYGDFNDYNLHTKGFDHE